MRSSGLAGTNGDVSPDATIADTILTSVTPSTGAVNSKVVINGTGFTPTGNNIHFGLGGVKNVARTTVEQLTFTIPTSMSACTWTGDTGICPAMETMVTLGTYDVWVENANGKSNTITYTVTAQPTATMN